MKTNEERKNELFTIAERESIESLKRTMGLVRMQISHPTYDANTVVAGGCFTSWLNGEDCKDIDVFYLNLNDLGRDNIIENMQRRFTDLHETTHEYKRGNPKITHVFTSHKSKYQFIFTTNKTREELLKDFDYVHTMVSYHMGDSKLYITRNTFDAIMNKHLIVNNRKNIQPWRRTKFLSKGWTDMETINLNEMSQNDFNAMVRQPANAGNWQSYSRMNPVRGSTMTIDYTSKLMQQHIDKLLQDLEENGQ